MVRNFFMNFCKKKFHTNCTRAKSGSIVSFNREETIDYELSADKFSWMVDDKMYDKLKHNYNECLDNIVKSFVAYRLAHDKIISYQSKFYQNNNILINLD